MHAPNKPNLADTNAFEANKTISLRKQSSKVVF